MGNKSNKPAIVRLARIAYWTIWLGIYAFRVLFWGSFAIIILLCLYDGMTWAWHHFSNACMVATAVLASVGLHTVYKWSKRVLGKDE